MTSRCRHFLAGALLLALGACLYEAWRVQGYGERIEGLKSLVVAARRSDFELRQAMDTLRHELARGSAAPAAVPDRPLIAAGSALAPVSTAPTYGRGIVDNRNGQVLDTFVQGFALTIAEKARLQAAIEEARSGIVQLKAAHTRIVEGTGDKSTTAAITIEPFPEGDLIREKLEQIFAAVLGNERSAVFRTHYAEEFLETAMNGSGRQSRNLAISRFADEYQVIDTTRELGPDGRMKSSAVVVRVRNLENPDMKDYREVFAPFVERLKALPALRPPGASQ